jgi:type IV pilus biogenesis protein CpaD/CtpE
MSCLPRVRILVLIAVIVIAGCADNSPPPLSDTLPAAGEAPRPIKRGATKLDGTESGAASQTAR